MGNDFLQTRKKEAIDLSWFKQTFFTIRREAVYVYYGIEPLTQKEKMLNNLVYNEQEFIKEFDKYNIYRLLRNEFPSLGADDIISRLDFIKFLDDMEIPIPEFLKRQGKSEQLNINDYENENGKRDLSSVKFEKIARNLARRKAKQLYSQEKYKNKPATELVKISEFSGLRKEIAAMRENGEDFSDKTYQRWISNLKPRLMKTT